MIFPEGKPNICILLKILYLKYYNLTKYSFRNIITSLSASSANEEVETVNYIISFILSVAANMVSNLISKWLSKDKHNN